MTGWVRNGWMGTSAKAGFLQSDVATRAAVNHAEFGQPDLLNAALKVALQRIGIAAIADHPEIAVLIVTPLAEEILRGSNRQRNQEDEAHDAEGANAVPEQSLPERREFFFHDRRILITSDRHPMNPATARRTTIPARGKMYRWR